MLARRYRANGCPVVHTVLWKGAVVAGVGGIERTRWYQASLPVRRMYVVLSLTVSFSIQGRVLTRLRPLKLAECFAVCWRELIGHSPWTNHGPPRIMFRYTCVACPDTLTGAYLRSASSTTAYMRGRSDMIR